MNKLKKRKWVIGAAWPYIHYIPHLGNLIGSILSADVFVRYLRLRGDDVIFVSGSDEHGTPIEVESIKLGIEPKELTNRMHNVIVKLFKLWNISFDNYTRTESEIHKDFVRNFMLKLYSNGYIFTKKVELPYCPRDKIFLPDRFVKGICPFCGYENAKGDQCERCGRLLEPKQLIEPRCSICGSRPEWRETIHWYMDLPKLQKAIEKYIYNNNKLPENAKNMSISFLKEGLKPRAVTRDSKWGIEAPFPGAEGKTLYVWFEAVLGYISATIEHFRKIGKEEEWKRYWFDKDTRVVFFIGKDNIPFHTIILPSLLIASGEPYVLPYTVSSTEYLLYEGKKFSKSQRIGIWIDEALNIMHVDYWRFVLIYMRPETKDSNFSWEQALKIINSILNDTIGNYIHRVLFMIKQKLGGVSPKPKNFRDTDIEFIENAKKLFDEVTKHYDNIELKTALHKTIDIARLGNRYLNIREPWKLLKYGYLDEAKTVLYTALWIVKILAIALYPVIPESMSKLWNIMGHEDPIEKANWFDAIKPIPSKLRITEAKPLFRKIEKDELIKKLKEIEKERSKKWYKKYPWEQIIFYHKLINP